VAGPNWSDDDPADTQQIVANAAHCLTDARQMAATRIMPTETDVKRWHENLYAGCTVPSAAYLGAFRGEPDPALVEYEVGVGPVMPDGWTDRVGVWSANVAAATAVFFGQLHTALIALDVAVAPGAPPITVDVPQEVVEVTAVAHGEWVRIHPFVNGNGRTARLLAAHISLRYGLPIFVTLRPRPLDAAYARASRRSMGRPPAFVGDHAETIAVFAHMLSLHLLGP
jgi:hypothetical protein